MSFNRHMSLRHSIYFKLTREQMRQCSNFDFTAVNLHEMPMHLFKIVTKNKELWEKMIELKRMSFKLVA